MALNGTLAITVHRIEIQDTAGDTSQPDRHCVTVSISGDKKYARPSPTQQGGSIERTINFDLKDMNGDADVLLEVIKNGTSLVTEKVQIRKFLQTPDNHVVTFSSESKSLKLYLSSKWTSKTNVQKYAGEGAATVAETVKAAATGDPQTAMALQGTHRPWFTRVSYYYDTTKYVYAYTTSFRVVSPFARFGESSANLVLRTVSGKNLHDLDQQFLVPVLDTLDNKVDATISTVVTKIFEGQQYVLKKKDDVVDTASSVASKGSSSLSSAVGTTVSGVVKAKDYTTTKLVNASSAAYSTVVSVKDYTTTQVVSVSSTTYKKARGATVFFVSHIPLLGAKLRT